MQTPAVKCVNLIIQKGTSGSLAITCLSGTNVSTRVVKRSIFWPTWPWSTCMFARMFSSATVAKFCLLPWDLWIEWHNLLWADDARWCLCWNATVLQFVDMRVHQELQSTQPKLWHSEGMNSLSGTGICGHQGSTKLQWNPNFSNIQEKCKLVREIGSSRNRRWHQIMLNWPGIVWVWVSVKILTKIHLFNDCYIETNCI